MSQTHNSAKLIIDICQDYESCKTFLSTIEKDDLKAINDLLLTAQSRVAGEWYSRREKERKEVQKALREEKKRIKEALEDSSLPF